MSIKAIVTTGQGGYERLVYKDVPMPQLQTGEVLLRVLAAGINNTDINTRVGWYDASVTNETKDAESAPGGQGAIAGAARGWNGATPFPLIQGADCCGLVVAVAPGEDAKLIGERVLVRSCMRRHGFDSPETYWLGSDFDGAFAQFVKVPASEIFAVHCDWSDVELATIPCAYGTAENMLHRARVGAGDHVLVPGASGGVGSAVVQLALRRGATVTAITTPSKLEQVRAIGATRVLMRHDDIVNVLGESSVDVVVDNVAGPAFGVMVRVLRPGGRYVSSGAIGGPLVTLDMRSLYLKDLILMGSTAWDAPVFTNLVGYIERGEIRPLLAQVFALSQIAEAQRFFLDKAHVGKLVLVPCS